MLIQPTLDTLNRLKLHGMALALCEQMTHNAAQGLAFEERLALLLDREALHRECGTAKHGPDSEPGSRVTCAGPRTRGCKQESQGETDSAPASHVGRCSSGWVPLVKTRCRCRSRCRYMGCVRGELGGQPSGTSRTCPHGSVSSVALSQGIYTQA